MGALTARKLRSLVCYDPSTGLFVAKIDTHKGRWKAGRKVGNLQSMGYLAISIEGKTYLAHRLAWLYMTGKWPKHLIDHKDRDKRNNRWENLREATVSLNQANRKVGNQSRTGTKGVSRCKATGKFRADITVNRKRKNLGRYNSVEEAQAAYLAAATDHFGEFARSG